MEVDADTKLYEAALECLQSGKITALLKEELKYTIQTRRLSEGKEELMLEDTPVPPPSPLRPDEIERRHKRREQNRKAATKFRQKRKGQLDNLQKFCMELQRKNSELQSEVDKLTAERDALHASVVSMVTGGPFCEPVSGV